MKKKYKILILVFIMLIMFVIFTMLGIKNTRYNRISQDIQNTYNQMKDNSVMYNENPNLSDLKNEYSITGEDSLYEIQTEYDGRKVITVKSNINYKVAFAGLIEKAKPTYTRIDKIFKENHPTKSGVWIEKDSKEKILQVLRNNCNSEYEISEEGYLKIVNKNSQNDNDIKIEKAINGNEKYILSISSSCYMVDAVTGEIIENPYEDLDKYQTYEYFNDDNNMIIFITENSEGKLTENEIFESVLNLINQGA